MLVSPVYAATATAVRTLSVAVVARNFVVVFCKGNYRTALFLYTVSSHAPIKNRPNTTTKNYSADSMHASSQKKKETVSRNKAKKKQPQMGGAPQPLVRG
jgi:hypothetical protein